MTAEVLKELKSRRSELTVQMKKLGDDLTNFQQETNARLSKIESVMSKIDDIDNLNDKAKELNEEVNRMKDSLTSTKSFVGELDDKMVEFKKGRDNNCVIGIDEEEGEDCMALVLNILTLLGFEDA